MLHENNIGFKNVAQNGITINITNKESFYEYHETNSAGVCQISHKALRALLD